MDCWNGLLKDILCCFAPFPSKIREKFFFTTYPTNLLNFVKKSCHKETRCTKTLRAYLRREAGTSPYFQPQVP